MSDVGAVGQNRHFNPEEEAALRADTSTGAIMKQHGKVEVHGSDPRWRDVKADQQRRVCGSGAAELGATTLDAGAIAGFEVAGAIGAALDVAAPVVALVLGAHSLVDAHENAAEQKAAISRDDAHYVLIGALDVPTEYKMQRMDVDYKGVQANADSPTTRMSTALNANPNAMLLLQLHCDRGLNAARDAGAAGQSKAAFLASHPKAKEAYEKDAAFHEGFDAYFFTKEKTPQKVPDLDRQIDARDGWYAQSNVAVRV